MVRIILTVCVGIWAMYKYVPDAKPYFFALADHTFTLLAGCGATVILGLLQRYVFKTPLSLKWEMTILLAFVFSAGFQAWRDEHQKATQTETKLNELTKPQLVCKLGTLTFGKGKPKDNDVVAVVTGTIANIGGPTVLDYWTLALRLEDGSVVHAEPIIPMGRGGRLTLSGGPLGFDASDFWADQARSVPIARGGAASGWLYFVFRGDSWEELNKGQKAVSVILGVTDINDKVWAFETPITAVASASAPISPADVMELHINKGISK